MKQTIYSVPERNKKVSNKVIQSVRDQHYTPTFTVLSENFTVTSDACTVELIVRIQQDQFLITGSSRRARGDRSDYEVGYYVALARAYTNLGNRLTKRAEGLVSHHDDVQKRQRAAKEAAAAGTTETIREFMVKTGARRAKTTGRTTTVRNSESQFLVKKK